MNSARTHNPRPAATIRWRRWLVVAVLSLLLHALMLNWATGNFRLTGQDSPVSPVMRTVLLPPPMPQQLPKAAPVQRANSPAPAKPPTPRPQPHPKALRPAAAPPSPDIAAPIQAALPPLATPEMPPDAQAPMQAEAGQAEIGFGDPSLAALAAPTTTQNAPPSDNGRYKVDPPPSAALKYDVQALRDGQVVYGHGTIAWQFNGSQYAINGDAGILFFSLLGFSSRGQVGESGIAPLQYTEKRFRRQQTETRFNPASKLISFSASTRTFPLQGGEQDRASIIWQLAGIGRGDATRFVPNAQFPLFVAGVRDGVTWNIQVLGEEEIEVGLGRVRAWHVRRAPRAGERDQIIDIWLAPAHNWYPVQLRYTESSGEYLELSLSSIDVAAPR